MLKSQAFLLQNPSVFCLNVLLLQCLAEGKIHRSRASSQTTIKRLKRTPGETPALRKEVKLVYFSNVIPVPPVGPFSFEDVPLCEVCSTTPRVTTFCAPPCPVLTDPVSRGQDQLLVCSCGIPSLPPVPSFSTHKPHNTSTSTTHLPLF